MSEEQEKQTETENKPALENVFTMQQGWDDFAKFCYPHIEGEEDLTEAELIARQYVFLAGAKVAMQVHGCGMFFSRCKANGVIGQIHQMVEVAAERDMYMRLKDSLSQMLKQMKESTPEQPDPSSKQENDQCDSGLDSSLL